jgi:serine phosphatase RsbU (regulator of sigma subunit)
MGQLRTALRAYAAEGHSPSAVMAHASAFLGELETERLATCVYATVSPDSGQVFIARAGHPDPLVRYAAGDVAELASAGGLPLGIHGVDVLEFPTTCHHLRRGDTLLLCTDGLLESRARSIASGSRQLRDAFRQGPDDMDALADHIVGAMSDSRVQEDDVALLLATLRATGPDREP